MAKGKVDALLGIVFGDEGKGKVVDYFTPQYDVIARFAGGPNAGHTIIFEGKKFVLRSIPSGIFDEGKINIIGNGCVIAPDLFMAEARNNIVMGGKVVYHLTFTFVAKNNAEEGINFSFCHNIFIVINSGE